MTKVGTGFSEQELAELHEKFSKEATKSQHPDYRCPKKVKPDVWFPPTTVIEVAYDSLTPSLMYKLEDSADSSAGLSLRFPRLVRIRTDKSPEQATTLAQLLEFHRMASADRK